MDDSEYGEVNDVLDKVKLFSNLRIQAYEQGLDVHNLNGDEIRKASDVILGQIKDDLEYIIKNVRRVYLEPKK